MLKRKYGTPLDAPGQRGYIPVHSMYQLFTGTYQGTRVHTSGENQSADVLRFDSSPLGRSGGLAVKVMNNQMSQDQKAEVVTASGRVKGTVVSQPDLKG